MTMHYSNRELESLETARKIREYEEQVDRERRAQAQREIWKQADSACTAAKF